MNGRLSGAKTGQGERVIKQSDSLFIEGADAPFILLHLFTGVILRNEVTKNLASFVSPLSPAWERARERGYHPLLCRGKFTLIPSLRSRTGSGLLPSREKELSQVFSHFIVRR